jgi:hypothetical protein
LQGNECGRDGEDCPAGFSLSRPSAGSALADEKRRAKQMDINFNFLMGHIERIHDALCPDHIGTWQQRAEAATKAAELIAQNH